MIRFMLLVLDLMIGLVVPCLITHTWTTKVAVPGLANLPADAPVLVTGDYAVEVEVSLNPGDTSIEVDVGTIDKTKIQSVVINADIVALNVFTNAADGTGGQSFPLAANKSVAWCNQIPNQINPITVNITKFFLNNPGTKIGVFRAGFVLNA